jgi:D-galactonate transporter
MSESKVYGTVTKRLMPLLFLCYIFAYIDRVNIGFAKLQMARDLQMSNAVYGMGAGIFFVGYFFFEIPANMLLVRLGARLWLGAIMIIWGIASTATMFVQSANEFYLVRFLLGTVEAGFFPGVILYLTFWYPERYRARILAIFMSAIPLSGVVSGALSGWILAHTENAGGLHAWQWLYLLEGIPPVAAGIVALALLPNGPRDAGWLSEEEKTFLAERVAVEEETKGREKSKSKPLLEVFKNPAVWLLCLIFFGFVMASYGIGFWLPQILSETMSADPLRIGLLSMIPWGVGAVAMLLVGRHSDATGERRWHISVSGLMGAAGFAFSAIPGLSPEIGLLALSIATAGVMASIATFWSLPSRLLSAMAAATGIAWINSVGSLAGYVSPNLIGMVRDRTHSMTWPLLVLAGSCLVASLAVLAVSLDSVSDPAADLPENEETTFVQPAVTEFD